MFVEEGDLVRVTDAAHRSLGWQPKGLGIVINAPYSKIVLGKRQAEIVRVFWPDTGEQKPINVRWLELVAKR